MLQVRDHGIIRLLLGMATVEKVHLESTQLTIDRSWTVGQRRYTGVDVAITQ